MVAGHLQEKGDLYYMVLSYKDENGKRHQPWFPTGLPVKGNKRRAEKMLDEMRSSFVIPKVISKQSGNTMSSDMLFSDFMLLWLEIIKSSVAQTTFSSYTMMVKKKIVPYFKKLGITLGKLEARHIQAFYIEELKSISANSVIHEHANIHKALKYAMKMDLILTNPADKIERPKKEKYLASYYTSEELYKLFEKTQDHKMGLMIQVAAFYGLRRSEVIGLRWEAFDFERDTLSIRHIVTSVEIDGKETLIHADRAKTKSSLRTLPLVGSFRDRLLALKQQQEKNRQICGNAYNTEFLGYVFVDELGNIIKPNYVTGTFRNLLKKHGLREIRFHDLRHSCASLLLSLGVPMKQIQEWLGHSDISTTSNIYAHLDYQSKVSSAEAMVSGLTLPEFTGIKNVWE